jgi:hypothetical protein
LRTTKNQSGPPGINPSGAIDFSIFGRISKSANYLQPPRAGRNQETVWYMTH